MRHGARRGFTLAEVAVTLVIVGIGTTLVMQGIITAKMAAAQTHHRKVARGLALLTLGQLESGLFWEELDGGDGDVLSGTYADEGYEYFQYELVLGDEEFTERADDEGRSAYHDTWQAERDRQERLRDDKDEKDDDEKVAEPFEKVRIKVTFPKLGDRPNELVLEDWVPWQQVYGNQEGEDAPAPSSGESQP